MKTSEIQVGKTYRGKCGLTDDEIKKLLAETKE